MKKETILLSINGTTLKCFLKTAKNYRYNNSNIVSEKRCKQCGEFKLISQYLNIDGTCLDCKKPKRMKLILDGKIVTKETRDFKFDIDKVIYEKKCKCCEEFLPLNEFKKHRSIYCLDCESIQGTKKPNLIIDDKPVKVHNIRNYIFDEDDVVSHKKCNTCKEFLLLEKFYSTNKSRTSCKKCIRKKTNPQNNPIKLIINDVSIRVLKPEHYIFNDKNVASHKLCQACDDFLLLKFFNGTDKYCKKCSSIERKKKKKLKQTKKDIYNFLVI